MDDYPHIAQLLEKEAANNAKFAGKSTYTAAEMLEIWNSDSPIA